MARAGFHTMDPEKQRAVASSGGRKAHEIGAAHEWTTREAREAGRKGGNANAAARLAKKRALREEPARD